MWKITRECYRICEDQDGYHEKGPGTTTTTTTNNNNKTTQATNFFLSFLMIQFDEIYLLLYDS